MLLKAIASAATLAQKFDAIINKCAATRPPMPGYPFQDQYFPQPVRDLHLHAGISFDVGVKGNRQYIYLFSWVAGIVLLLPA